MFCPKSRIPPLSVLAPHAFRRGTSQELKESGSPWSAVSSSGVWQSADFRGYVDMSRGVELGVQHLFDADMDSDSNVEEPVHLGLADW